MTLTNVNMGMHMSDSEYKAFIKRNYGKCRMEECPFYSFDGQHHICGRFQKVHYLQAFEIKDEHYCVRQNKEDYIKWKTYDKDKVKWDEDKQRYFMKNVYGDWLGAWIDENGRIYVDGAGS